MQTLGRFHGDLDKLGLRRRRQYDSRRTFISLARGDGARKDVLCWVTHGPEGDVFDDYTTLPWPTLCAAVACLRIELREGRVLPFAKAANSGGVDGELVTVPVTVASKVLETQRAQGKSWRGVRDSNPWPPA